LDLVFDFAKYVVQVCFLFIPYPELHQKSLIRRRERKEVNQCLGEESYTLSDMRESFEEQNFILILIENLSKTQVI